MHRPTNGDFPQPPALPPGGVSGHPVAGPPTARAWPTPVEMLNALKRRAVLATLLGVLVGLAAAAGVWLAMPSGKHQVRAQIQIRPSTSVVSRGGFDQEFDSFRRRQQHLLTSRLLLNQVVADPAVAKLPDVVGSDDPVRLLEEAIRVKSDTPELMVVTMNGDDPKQLKTILTAVITQYLRDAESDDMRSRRQRLVTIQKQIADYNKMIETEENLLKNMALTGHGPTTESQLIRANITREQIHQTSQLIAAAERELQDLKAQAVVIQAKLGGLDQIPIDPDDLDRELARQPQVQEKWQLLQYQKQKMERVQASVSPDSELARREVALFRKATDELTAAQTAARPAVEDALRAVERKRLRSKLEELNQAAQIRELARKDQDDKHKKLLKAIEDNGIAGFEVQKTGDDLKPLKETRAQLRRAELELTSLNDVEPRVTKLEDPVVILNQVFRQRVLFSAVAFLGGFGGILAAVGYLEWRSRRIDGVDQVVTDLGLRVLGTIPAFPSKASLQAGDAAQSQNWRFVLNESVNSARTMLLHTAKTRNMQVLMVTSAMQGEGKTSLASQLATSMAAAGLRTLALDCDLRNPSLHKLFDAPLTPGAAEVLLQEVDVSDAVQPTAIPNLWVVPAGQCSSRVVAALAQGNPLETLFNRLRGQFDFIVVDSCPVLPVADALLVGQHVDGVVISVLQDISQLPKVQTASDKLTLLNIPVLGAVVNGIKPDVYAYGYNYVKQLPA